MSDITDSSADMSAGEIAYQIVGKLMLTVFASLAIGAICGIHPSNAAIVCSFCFKNFRFLVQNEITQVVITYLFGILSYVIAETLDMSGVITVLVCGILLAHYNYYNLTPGGMHATT